MHPAFLTSVTQLNERIFQAAFTHSYKLAKGQTLVIYAQPPERVTTLFLFVTGNPGILPLYRSFLDKIATSAPDIAVFGHALSGQVSEVPTPPESTYSLDAQVDANIELFDSLLTLFDKNVKVVLCGHSVGAWIMCNVAKRRPDNIDALFLVTPAICNISSSPNGRRQGWMFTPFGRTILPICAWMLQPIASLIAPYIVPPGINKRVDAAHYEMVKDKASQFISHPSILYAALTLAQYEMREIKELDREFLQKNREKIFCLFARVDNWVGKNRAEIEEALGLTPGANTPRSSEGEPGIPHAFCFEHNIPVANVCIRWLEENIHRPEGAPAGGPREVESIVSPRNLVEELFM
ncbi:alpha/beta-hydrolase [Dacryopinax primogenitus]|uniref:Alpha/beta-hydrolase n=1 Tax=Dacryopinax primogenitus (strain DJM 731) TaxID=1858805 RepID=M5FW38_DACPD|nr:alpha/beta-hydrolase [Dacryopinax primogenitus]EJT97581.1 alpha/beta-hydrolase [Dacryopinax primogenitus]